MAVSKAARDGKKHLIKIPLSKSLSFPHFAEAYSHSAKVGATLPTAHACSR